MTPLFEAILTNGLLLDSAGIIGLGLVGLAAAHLARRNPSWDATMMAVGAIALLLARFYLVISPHFMTDAVLHDLGPVGISLTIGAPPLLLSLGLAAIVWGLWGHERWLSGKNR